MEVRLLEELGTGNEVTWEFSYVPCCPSPLTFNPTKAVVWIVPDNPKIRMKHPNFKTTRDND